MKALFYSVALLAAAAPAAAADFVPYSAVLVNGQRIPAERIRIDLEADKHTKAMLHGGAQREPGKVAVDATIDRLVVRELLVQESRARGFAVSDAERAAAWEGERKRWGSPEGLAKSLQVRGITEAFMKERLAEDLAIRKIYAAAVDAKVRVSEKEERSYFEKNAALFRKDVPPQLRLVCFDFAKHGGADAARTRLNAFWERFSRGENFAVLATEYSDHPSAAKGGAVDDSADPLLPFLEIGRTLRPSQYCDPQADDKALYIYWRESTPPLMSFDESRARVRETLTNQMRESLFADLVTGLKSKARIEYVK